MNSSVRAVLVVWPGKAAVNSLVDRLRKGGKPKLYNFCSWKFLKIVKIVSPTIFKRKFIIKQILLPLEHRARAVSGKLAETSAQTFFSFSSTVVHLTNRVGTKSIWAGACLQQCMSKDFLRVHTYWHKREYWCGICGFSTIINFRPKKHKIRKIGYFQLGWNGLKSFHIYQNQQNIVSTDQK